MANSTSVTSADPTTTIDSLVSKFTLAFIIMAAAFLFYGISNKKTTTIPRKITVIMAIILLLLSDALSVIATYEFYNIVPSYKNCSNCLYSSTALYVITTFYCVFSVVFVVVNIYICYLLMMYHKKGN